MATIPTVVLSNLLTVWMNSMVDRPTYVAEALVNIEPEM
jgi:hypothetical protein